MQGVPVPAGAVGAAACCAGVPLPARAVGAAACCWRCLPP
jgi:hypothetical protein